MQFSPTVAIDLMSTVKPDNTSAGKTGQESAFAGQLANAAQGQTASTRQPETGDTPKNIAKTTKKTLHSAAEETAPQTAAPGEPNSSPDQTATKPVVADAPEKSEATADLTAGTTINGSAGAATAAIVPLPQASFDVSNLVEQRRGSVADQSDAIVSRMLSAITSTAAETTAVATTNTGTAAATFATLLAGQAAAPTNPAPVQAANLGEKQTLAAAVSLPATSGLIPTGETSAGVTATTPSLAGQAAAPTNPAPVQAASLGEKQTLASAANLPATGELIPTGDAPLQSPATVPFSAETTGNSGTAPLAQAMSTPPAPSAPVEPEAPQGIAQQNAAQENNQQVVQNKYGQIITIHQLSDPEGTAAAGVGAKTPATVPGSQSQEADSNFIRAHLASDAPKTVTNENSAQQQQTSKDHQPKGANPAEGFMEGASLAEQTASQKPQFTLGSENQSLVFAHQGVGSSPAASTSSTDAFTLRLPSGLAVPDGSVVDQMLSHFTMNKQLESGTVNLKLHPQELGELRMEIKVVQDNIRAHIVAQNPQAQEMIERHLPRLRETLAQQGLQLQHIEVTVAANDSAGGEPYQDNTRQQLRQSMNKHTGQSIFTLDPEEELLESAASVNNLSVLA